MGKIKSNLIWYILCTIVDKLTIDYNVMKPCQPAIPNCHLQRAIATQLGYTLIEITIVIAIIGILAVIGVVSYQTSAHHHNLSRD